MASTNSENVNTDTASSDKTIENYGENCLCFGFIDTETESWRLSSKYFPSKVGGKPAWLALTGIPTLNMLKCQSCDKPLTFLCQLYLPNSSHDYAFHRTIFIFVCRNGKCCLPNHNNGIKVFRCQLPRRNDFYPYEPPEEQEATHQTPSACDYMKLCNVCGIPGDKLCSKCRVASYCSKEHQIVHWNEGHKTECGTGKQHAVTSTSFLFPEAELILEPSLLKHELCCDEEAENEELSEAQINEELAKIQTMFPESTVKIVHETDNERKKDSISDDSQSPTESSSESKTRLLDAEPNDDLDPIFSRFRELMAIDGDKVIRYHRGGKPLLCSARQRPRKNLIKPCPRCLEPRQFEFQILPQMLSHLNVDQADARSLDWGVLLVYTCHCDIATDYVPEIVFKQDYSEKVAPRVIEPVRTGEQERTAVNQKKSDVR